MKFRSFFKVFKPDVSNCLLTSDDSVCLSTTLIVFPQVTFSMNMLVQYIAQQETNIVSCERVIDYANLPHEVSSEVTSFLVYYYTSLPKSIGFKSKKNPISFPIRVNDER